MTIKSSKKGAIITQTPFTILAQAAELSLILQSSFSQTVQNVMSGLRNASRSKANTLSGGECAAIVSRGAYSNCAISGPLK